MGDLYKTQKQIIMKSIAFSFENIRKVEEFTGANLYFYSQIGIPSGTFRIPKSDSEPEREFKLLDGESIFKDESGKLYLAV